MIQSKQIQRPQTILVVDDQEINRDVLEIILEEEYEVLFAANGREALDVMADNQNDYQDDMSLNMLPERLIDVLKMDMRFVRDIEAERN